MLGVVVPEHDVPVQVQRTELLQHDSIVWVSLYLPEG
uniref:Uncharacterized protein n=1 Tax=Arundo donax TaxID=35708 RepID=A0A0A9BCZ7_ARUDO